MLTKYRLKAYDVAADIYFVQKRFLFMWWTCPSFGVGKKEKMTPIIEAYNGTASLDGVEL